MSFTINSVLDKYLDFLQSMLQFNPKGGVVDAGLLPQIKAQTDFVLAEQIVLSVQTCPWRESYKKEI